MNLRLQAEKATKEKTTFLQAVAFPQACLTIDRSWFSAKKYVFEL